MSDATKCDACGGYYDDTGFKVIVNGPRGQSCGDCCSVGCVGVLSERLAQRFARAKTERVKHV